MNLYFLVEGESCEKQVYPAWLSYLLPELEEVEHYNDVQKNNYFLISGKGYPSIIHNYLARTIEEIQEVGKYNYLVMCVDSDDVSIDERKQEIYDYLISRNLTLGNTRLFILVQNRCFETWCLGNRRIYIKNPQNTLLKEYTNYYNVFDNCPELMGNYNSSTTHGQFHKSYLKEIFKARRIKYTENNPGEVMKSFYLEQLKARTKDETEHLPTFQAFIQFCNMIKPKLSS